MKVRFYLAPIIGTGIVDYTSDPMVIDPFRNIISNYIDVAKGGFFDECHYPARNLSICCVHGSVSQHAAILLESGIVPLSPLFNDESDISMGLDTVLNTIPGIATVKTKLEANGINTSWITGTDTVRDAIRYLVRLFTISGINYGEGQTPINYGVRNFLRLNLDTTIGTVDTEIKLHIRNWMITKGLDTSWITNSNTVREVLHFIINNFNLTKFRLRLSGQEF